MNTWTLVPGTLIQPLAATLLHFLWQGGAVSLVILVLGWLFRMQRPASLYALALLGLLVMAACPVVTFWLVSAELGWLPGVSESLAMVKPGEPPGDRAQSAHAPVAEPRFIAVSFAVEDAIMHGPWLPRAQRGIVFAWMLGVTVLGSRLFVGWIWLHWLRRGLEPVPPALAEQAVVLCRALWLCLPRLHGCRQIHEAIATGLLRPLVLFPVTWLTELPPDMLEAVLAHELAHLHRWDLWVNAFQRLIETLLFYHPAVWWLSRRLRVERELCCDELAVLLTRDRLRYAQTLEQVGRLVALGTSSDLALTIRGKHMTLLLRVKHLLHPRPVRLSPTPWLAGLIAVALPLAVWWLAVSVPVAESLAGEEGTAVQPARGIQARTVAVDSDQVLAVAFSADSKLVAGGGFAKDIKVWDAQTGKLMRTLVGHSGMVRAIAFAPRGHILVSGGDDQALRIWDALCGDLKHTISPVPAGVQSVAVSPDGKSIVSASTKWLGPSGRIEGEWTGEVDLWDAQRGTLQWQHKLDDPVFSVAFSGDGRTIASSGFHVRIWETETGALKRTLKPERGAVYALAFSPDGKILVGGDRFYVRAGEGTVGLSEVYFWNAQTGELQRTLAALSPWLRAVALSADGSVLATGTSGPTKTSPDQLRSWVVSEIKLWDVGTGQLLRTLEGELGDVMSLAFSPDGRTIVYADNQTVKLLEAATGKDKETLMTKTMRPFGP